MAKPAPLLADLREPPVPGRFYLVPVVRRYPWHGRVDDWPVIGPKHDDREHFNFPDVHYHLDPRFLTSAQEQFVRRQGARVGRSSYTPGAAGDAVEYAVSGYPLSNRDWQLPPGRPELVRRRCRRASYTFGMFPERRVQSMRAALGDPAEPIRLADGRLLCPHRKVDLSQFPPDESGIVTCPLHGLRVRCGVAA